MQQMRDGEGRNRPRARTADDVDVALVKLVLAGAPTEWLWVEPDVIDLARTPGWRVLAREIERQSEYSATRLAALSGGRRRASEIWREVGRVWRQWRRRWSA